MFHFRFFLKSKNHILFIIILFLTSCSIFKIIPSNKIFHLKYEENSQNLQCDFFYSDYRDSEYLTKLRNDYDLDDLVKNSKNELEKVLIILDWTSKQWEHSGSNTPKKNDALSILEEAKAGNNFRCVEYGIVGAAAVNSIGLQSRDLGLMTKDVEQVRVSAGHIVFETYLNKYKKWIFVDPQWNLVPIINDVPLNAIELQKAIVNQNSNLKFINHSGKIDDKTSKKYKKWIGKYLFYLNVSFDNRIEYGLKKTKCDGKSGIMLVPLHAKEPKVFQRKYKIKHLKYTNSVKDFYQKPR